jgi:hypothetical protein
VSSHLRNGHLKLVEIVLRCSDIPGQQILDAVDQVIGDLFEHAAEVEFRIKPVQFRRSQQRIDRGCTFATRIGPTEQEILPAQSPSLPFTTPVSCKAYSKILEKRLLMSRTERVHFSLASFRFRAPKVSVL